MSRGEQEGRGERTLEALHGISSSLRDISKSLGEVRERVAGQEGTTKSLWHEVRELGRDLKQQIRELPETVAEGISRHELSCPAREVAIRRLKNSHASVPPSKGEPSQVVVVQKESDSAGFVLPRPVLWLGAIIGIAVAVATFVLAKLGFFSV